MRIFLLLLTLAYLPACSSGTRLPDEVTRRDPGRHQETIVIVGMNDFHGALAPLVLKTKEAPGTEPIEYESGGAAMFAAHVNRLREEFGPNLLVLDAGDEYQGTIESNLEEGAPVVQFYNALGVHAAALGNHEFDFGPVGAEGATGDILGALKQRMSEARFPFVVSNIVEKNTKRPPELPNSQPHLILNAGQVKVGVIGLTTLDTPITTRAAFVQGLQFTDLREATIREAAALRRAGAQVIVVTAHVGLKCSLGRAPIESTFRKESDPLGECGEKDEMVRLLRSLPEGTIDAVVSGHSHSLVHHWIAGIPVVQGGTRGQYLNVIYLTYDHDAGKLLTDRTRIEGPVPICREIFENQGDCNGDRPVPKNGRGDLETPVFHGRSMRADGSVEALLAPTFAKSAEEKKRIVGHAARPITHTRIEESELGNLVTDALREQMKTDFAFVNSGGLRAPFDQGPITYEALFRTMPFDNSVSVVTVTGKELRAILRTIESGSRGFFPISGLRVRVIDPKYDAPSGDLDKDGKIAPWEINRLIEVRSIDGKIIHDERKYKIATVDFLVTGGDDLGWAMGRIPRERIELGAGPVIREVVEAYFKNAGPLNPPERPLIDPEKPRLKFEKPASPRVRRKKKG